MTFATYPFQATVREVTRGDLAVIDLRGDIDGLAAAARSIPLLASPHLRWSVLWRP